MVSLAGRKKYRQMNKYKWEDVLRNKDKEIAKKIEHEMNEYNKNISKGINAVYFEQYARLIEYPKTNVWKKGVLNTHFQRTMVEIKLLSVWGGTSLKYIDKFISVIKDK